MKSIKLFFSLFIVAFFVASTGYAGLDPATQLAFQTKEIRGIGKVYQMATMEGSIYIATQKPTQAGLKHLKKLKIKTFINLLPESEATQFDEASAVKKAGMKYVHIPVDLANFSMDTIKQFNKAVYPPKDYPIFIHCAAGNRVAMMMAFNNITQHGVPPKIAIDEAKNYGLKAPKVIEFIEQAVKKYNLSKR